MLDTKLIISSLELTGKTMEDMEIFPIYYDGRDQRYAYDELEFSIKNFCYYLLSPEFIEKYQENCINDFESYTDIVLSELFGRALYLYQLGQKHHLIELLSKIK